MMRELWGWAVAHVGRAGVGAARATGLQWGRGVTCEGWETLGHGWGAWMAEVQHVAWSAHVPHQVCDGCCGSGAGVVVFVHL